MGNVSSDTKVTQSTKLAQHGGISQNPSLTTTSGVDFHSREIGTPWHPSDLGVGKILGLRGMQLNNTSHINVGMESFRSKPSLERTPVTSVHTPPSGQVLPPGPVDSTMDFTGLRGEITNASPNFGRANGSTHIGTHSSGASIFSGGGFGGGNGLASADIRDLMKNKRNYTGWARHGGVDPAGGPMVMPIPPFLENVPYPKVQIKQQYPKMVSQTSAQGFFD